MKACDWVVYAKRPFAGPQQVLDYVGRYTHRVAISNNRLLDIEGDQVQFKWKDYRNGDQVKAMTLSAAKEEVRPSRTCGRLQRAQAVCQAGRPFAPPGLGRLRQACLRRTSASAALSRPLHSPRCHLESS